MAERASSARPPQWDVLAELAGAATRRARDFTALDTAAILLAFAHSGHHRQAVFEALGAAAAELAPTFTTEAASSLLVAHARAGRPLQPALQRGVLAALERPAAWQLPPREVAETVWALTRLRIAAHKAYEAGVASALGQLRGFALPDLSLLVWAVSSAGMYDPDLLEVAAPLLAWQLQTEPFEAQALSRAAHAYARPRYYHPLLAEAVAQAATLHAAALVADGRTASHVLVALSRLHHRDERLIRAWTAAMLTASGDGGGSSSGFGGGGGGGADVLVVTAVGAAPDGGACETVGAAMEHHSGAVGAVMESHSGGTAGGDAQRLQAFLQRWSAGALAALAHSLAFLCHEQEEALMRAAVTCYAAAIAPSAPSSAGRSRHQHVQRSSSGSSGVSAASSRTAMGDIVKVAWACAVLDVPAWRELELLLGATAHFPPSECSRVDLSQLWMVQMWLQACIADGPAASADGPSPSAALAALPRGLADRARAHWVGRVVPATSVSPFQEDLRRDLGRLGLQPKLEQATPDGMFSLDVALHMERGAPVAVEADGPFHYAVNGTPLPHLLGPARLRDRLLRSHGWRVLRVSFFDYVAACSRQEGAKLAWLQGRLDAVLAARAGGGGRAHADDPSGAAAAAHSAAMVHWGKLPLHLRMNMASALQQEACTRGGMRLLRPGQQRRQHARRKGGAYEPPEHLVEAWEAWEAGVGAAEVAQLRSTMAGGGERHSLPIESAGPTLLDMNEDAGEFDLQLDVAQLLQQRALSGSKAEESPP